MTCSHWPLHRYRWIGSEHGIHDSGEGCAECDANGIKPRGPVAVPNPAVHPRVA